MIPLAIVGFVVVCGAVVTYLSPLALRQLAAWCVNRAFYIENLRAERDRCREMARERYADHQRAVGLEVEA